MTKASEDELSRAQAILEEDKMVNEEDLNEEDFEDDEDLDDESEEFDDEEEEDSDEDVDEDDEEYEDDDYLEDDDEMEGLTREQITNTTDDLNAVVKETAAVAGELKDAFDDIKSAFSLGSLFK